MDYHLDSVDGKTTFYEGDKVIKTVILKPKIAEILRDNNIKTNRTLCQKSPKDLIKIPLLSKEDIDKIKKYLKEHNLKLGTKHKDLKSMHGGRPRKRKEKNMTIDYKYKEDKII